VIGDRIANEDMEIQKHVVSGLKGRRLLYTHVITYVNGNETASNQMSRVG